MNPPEIDAKIVELSDLLEKQASSNYRYATAGAEAEAAYRLAKAKAQLEVRAELQGTKFTEAQVDATVEERTHEAHREFLIKQAKHEAARDSLFATRARLDAMRTVAAGNREAVK